MPALDWPPRHHESRQPATSSLHTWVRAAGHKPLEGSTTDLRSPPMLARWVVGHGRSGLLWQATEHRWAMERGSEGLPGDQNVGAMSWSPV
jgi:hypothetical protein